MREFIYCHHGKYYRTLTDLLGKVVYMQEISKEEYLKIKEKNNG